MFSWPVYAAIELGRDPDLPADLGDRELEALLEGRLSGAGERVPDRLLDPVEVLRARVRPGEPAGQRIERVPRIGVEREGVHERPGAAARAVRRTGRGDEVQRRDRDVGARPRVVVAPLREGEAEHADLRIDRLQRVVARRERAHVGRGRELLAAGPELRLPEAGLVRLVADDEVPHSRVAAREPLEERGVLRRRVRIRRVVLRVPEVDVDDDAHARELRLRDRSVEKRLLRIGRRVLRVPPDDDRVLGAVHLAELREERGAVVARVLARVVGDAERQAGARVADPRPEGADAGQRDRQTPHPICIGCSGGSFERYAVSDAPSTGASRAARLTALTTARSDAVTMLSSIPTPQRTWSPTAASM